MKPVILNAVTGHAEDLIKDLMLEKNYQFPMPSHLFQPNNVAPFSLWFDPDAKQLVKVLTYYINGIQFIVREGMNFAPKSFVEYLKELYEHLKDIDNAYVGLQGNKFIGEF